MVRNVIMIGFDEFRHIKDLLFDVEVGLVYEKNQKIGNTKNLQTMHDKINEVIRLFEITNYAEHKKAIEDVLTPEEFEEFNRNPDIIVVDHEDVDMVDQIVEV